MNAKRLLTLVALGAAGVVLWSLTRPLPTPATVPLATPALPALPAGQPAPAIAPQPVPAPEAAIQAPAHTPAPGNTPGTPPAAAIVLITAPAPEAAPATQAVPPGVATDISADLEAVGTTIRNYRTALGENPVGTNAEITRAFLGDNLKQVKLPAPQGSALNGEGELVDRFGTPYFFHQLSAREMEIRSAGPDRKMWSADDVTGR